MIRKLVTYSGRVQGVGFRYAAQRLAADYPVAGHVRNLPTGQVELAAEGDAAAVDEFLLAIANQMRGHIVETRIHDEEPLGARGFAIRY